MVQTLGEAITAQIQSKGSYNPSEKKITTQSQSKTPKQGLGEAQHLEPQSQSKTPKQGLGEVITAQSQSKTPKQGLGEAQHLEPRRGQIPLTQAIPEKTSGLGEAQH
ncbi:MAG: hypothetical protein KDC86_13990, partial [Saprospiraceae bacterium]|nr:hypothetical protein [Saprospiraceae bacterium]